MARWKYGHTYSNFIFKFFARNVDKIEKIDWIRFLNGNDDFIISIKFLQNELE